MKVKVPAKMTLVKSIPSQEQKVDIESFEKERVALNEILSILTPMSPNERRRILNYFWDRYVEHPDE